MALGLIFRPALAQANVDGRKTMTRRLRTTLKPGDVFWQRERWAVGRGYDGVKPSDLPTPDMTRLRIWWGDDRSEGRGQTRSPLHLPRALARFTARVVAVRVEPLDCITEEDARAEGVLWVPGHGEITPDELRADPGYSNFLDCRQGFQVLWNSINPGTPFASCPTVHVISYERIDHG